jgi:hypothetical protein
METRSWTLFLHDSLWLYDSLMTWGLDPDQEDARLGPSTDFCTPTESG